MAKPFSLQVLRDLMHTRVDEAVRKLGECIAAEQSARSRLELLGQYRQEYVDRFRNAQAGGMTPLAWQNYQDFLDKIDTAISEQNQRVDEATRATADSRNAWQAQNTRLKALDTLAARQRQNEARLELRQEQKNLDEFALRRFQPRETE
jgi:flagellar FliJ protein